MGVQVSFPPAKFWLGSGRLGYIATGECDEENDDGCVNELWFHAKVERVDIGGGSVDRATSSRWFNAELVELDWQSLKTIAKIGMSGAMLAILAATLGTLG